MGPIDALLHLANLFAMPLGTALIAALLAKVAGGRGVRAVPWQRLAAWACAAAVLALFVGLALEGRDGRMLTHGLVVIFVALALQGAALRRGKTGSLNGGFTPRASAPRRAANAAARS